MKPKTPIETDYFVGRFDVKIAWKDFVFYMRLQKATQKYTLKRSYNLLLTKMASRCDHVGVIHLPEFLIRPVDLNMSLYEPLLIHLSGVYNFKQQIESGK